MAIATGTAILGAAILGAGASVASSRSASRTAANAANYAADQNAAVNREIYNQTRSDLAPFRDAGLTGQGALMQHLGLSTGQAPAGGAPAPANGNAGGFTPGAPSGASQPAGIDYQRVFQDRPDVLAEYQRARASADPNSPAFTQAGLQSPEAYVDRWLQTRPAQDTYQPPQIQPTQTAQPGGGAANPQPNTPAPANPQYDLMTAQRPDAAPAPQYTRPDTAAPPSYVRPDAAPAPEFGDFKDPGSYGEFSFNPGDLANDPGYQFRQEQGMRGVNSGFAARGLLKSGGALKGAIDFNSGLASQEYQNAFNRAFQAWQANNGQRNTDRSFARNVFESDRGYGTDLWRYNTDRADQNFNSDRSYGTNLWADQRDFNNTNFNLDRAYGTDAYRYGQNRADNIFSEDRGYQTQRYDQRTSDLFNLTNMGQSAAAGQANAGNIFASNTIANNNNRANVIGNSAIANANAVGNAAGQVMQGVGMYYGMRDYNTPAAGSSNRVY